MFINKTLSQVSNELIDKYIKCADFESKLREYMASTAVTTFSNPDVLYNNILFKHKYYLCDDLIRAYLRSREKFDSDIELKDSAFIYYDSPTAMTESREYFEIRDSIKITIIKLIQEWRTKMTLLEFYEETKKNIEKVLERYGRLGELCYLDLSHILQCLGTDVYGKKENNNVFCNTDNVSLLVELSDQFNQISDSRKADEK